jgi:hypothetical protein
MSTCRCAKAEWDAHLCEIVEVVESAAADHADDHWRIG